MNLKLAGAEALSVNGQRLLFMSEIRCSGPTITINGKPWAAFVIAATGPLDEMKQAITAQIHMPTLIKSVYGIGIDFLRKKA